MGPDFWTRQFAQFIFTIASHGAAVFVSTLGIMVFGLGPVGRAAAARIRGGAASGLADDSLGDLKSGMTELQDRLDFSERVLTELRQRLLAPGDATQQPPPRRIVTPK
jgi:hypothetical protein